MVENVIGCKWSLTVIALVREGVCRPGAMEHAVPGLSKKVLNERLRKLLRFGVLERQAFAELPPRVEYRLSAFGLRFVHLIDEVAALQRQLDDAPARLPSKAVGAGRVPVVARSLRNR